MRQFFAAKAEHSNAAAMELILRATGLASEDKVLDVACGPGITECDFASVASRVEGIDLTPAMLEQAEAL